MTFGGAFTARASHSTYNVADIRWGELINAEVTVILDSAFSTMYSLGER